MHREDFQKEYYNQQNALWQLALPYQINVLSDILSLLPSDITSILDLGCGDGYITNRLPQHLNVLGVDWSSNALEHVTRERLNSKITEIPLPLKSYDLVMANDVIEHLDEGDYKLVLSEMDRLANKYILITVPFEERLLNNRTICLKCGNKFHINLHQRSFNLFKLLELLNFSSQWVVSDVIFSGEEYNSSYLLNEFFRENFELLRKDANALCPSCGSKSTSKLYEKEVFYEFEESTLISSTIKRICSRNECIILFRNTTNDSSKDNILNDTFLTLYEHESHKSINCEVDLENFSVNLGLQEISLNQSQQISLYINLQNIKFHLTRMLINEQNKIKIPEWFLYQIYECSNKDIFSFSLLNIKQDYFLNLQNANAELDHLKLRLGRAEQQNIDLQDAKAELDHLKLKLGQAEQQSIDLQNANAELDHLKLRLGQAEQQNIDLQNANAELDHLKLKLGQAEQQSIDLQNARAELDHLKLRLGQAEQQAIDLQNLRAELKHSKMKYRFFNKQQILDLSKPDDYIHEWDTLLNKKCILVTHDQDIDRRILQQVYSLRKMDLDVLIICLSHDQHDHFEKIGDTFIHRIGLSKIIPDCKVYWFYQRIHHLIGYSLLLGNYLKSILHKINWVIYKLLLKMVYRSPNVNYPLPFDLCFKYALDRYKGNFIIAYDLPALKACIKRGTELSIPVIYDAHELYSEQKVFSKYQKEILDKRESEYIKKCKQVMTVSASFSEIMCQRYNLKTVHVIKNSHLFHNIEKKVSLHDLIKKPKDEVILLFQGGLLRNRNLETILKGFLLLNDLNINLVFLGPYDTKLLKEMQNIGGSFVNRNVFFLPPVTQDELLDITNTATFGIIPYIPCDLNTKFCMPNKLFEYIQAELPILYHNELIEVEQVVKKIGDCGLAYNLSSPLKVKNGIKAMLERDLQQDIQIIKKSKATYSWEAEEELFLNIMKESHSSTKVMNYV